MPYTSWTDVITPAKLDQQIMRRLGTAEIHIGQNAGVTNQGPHSIAIGLDAGNMNQAPSAIAIGSYAGVLNQGLACIAIGNRAGEDNQHDRSMVLNASNTVLNTNGTDRFFVKPIRNASLPQTLTYDASSGEIAYTPSSSAVTQSILGGMASGLQNTTQYAGLFVASNALGTTIVEYLTTTVIPINCIISKLYILMNDAPGTTNQAYTYTIRKNSTSTALSASVVGVNNSGSNLVDTVAFQTGDTISMQITASNSPLTGKSFRWSCLMTS